VTIPYHVEPFVAWYYCTYGISVAFAYLVEPRKTMFNYCTRTAPADHMEVSR